MPIYYDSSMSGFGWTFWAILWLALGIWMIVCMWKVFKKAGRKWRESLIPIRNVWLLFKIADRTPRFWVLVARPLLTAVYSILQAIIPMWVVGSAIARILWLWSIVFLVAAITVQFWLAKKFWKSWWFGLWLLFLAPIFYGILAFDDSKYSA